ncbi:MAG: ribosome biogenesis GTPase Der [Rhodothermales bacterium]|nr:ribosome biogenesis GTPase Der [Rhodothermales bacterium]
MLVAIVGRPNVGKSTLFNRFTETQDAIVHDAPGVTRDRIYGEVIWNGRTFALVDTGGFVPRSAERFEAAIREQVHLALEEADAVVFVTDVTTGITDLDEEVAALLRRADKPVLVAANKADNDARRLDAVEFYGLGLGEVYPVSGTNGIGTGNLLDAVVEALPEEPDDEDEDERLRIAVIGRPNVGKSSFTNALLGEERSIVTEISGTTRDAVDSVLKYHGEEIVLVDTAGLRKRKRVHENVEFYSTLRTERAIRECDVAILLLDAEQGLEVQDIRVLKAAEDLRKGLVIGINKWDLVAKETNTARDYERGIKDRLQTLGYVPVVFMSALTKQRVYRLLDTALEVAERRSRRVPTSALNDVMLAAVERHHPPSYRGGQVKIKYVTQVKTRPPVFAFFCNHPKGIRPPYRRYLENRLREHFDFEGVPLTLVFRSKSKEERG